MKQVGMFLKRLLLVQVLVFTLTFGLAKSASARGIVYGDNLPTGAVIENDAIMVGDTVVIDGNVVGDVIAAGTNVEINGTIEGSLIVVGETVFIDGQVGGTTYAGAITLELGESSELGRNLYFAGLSLITQPGAQVGRDLFAASLLGANLAGETGRTVKAIIGPSEFLRLLLDAVGGQVFLPERSVLPVTELGSLREGKPGLDGALGSMGLAGLRNAAEPWLTKRMSSQVLDRPGNAVPAQDAPPGTRIDTERLGQWAQERLREFVVLLIYGFLGLWLFSPSLSRSIDALGGKPLPALGYGLLALVIAFNLFGVAALLGVLILIIGLWISSITLWELTFAFWATGYSTLVLATTLFTLFVMYGSKVIVAYFVGRMALKSITPQAADYKMLPLLIGLLLYVLLHSIPLVGWVIGALVMALGLGAAIVMYIDERRLAKAENV